MTVENLVTTGIPRKNLGGTKCNFALFGSVAI